MFPGSFPRLPDSAAIRSAFRLTGLLGAWQHTRAKSIVIGGICLHFSKEQSGYEYE
jgi:hypothetical protein